MTIGTEALTQNIAQLSEEEQTQVNSILAGFEVDDSGNLQSSTDNTQLSVISPEESPTNLGDDGVEGLFIQGGGSRTIDLSARTEDFTLIGGEGSETVTGGTGNDTFTMGGGNDTVNVRGGENTILTGEGDDVVDAEGTNTSGSTPSPRASDTTAPSYFDADQYLRDNSDVAAAVNSGAFSSAYEHFTQFGLGEGRSPNENFDNAFYLAQNSDVAAAVQSGAFASGLEHFILFGQFEGRQPSASVNLDKYLDANPDVEAASNAGTIDGYAHAFRHGASEGRAVSAQDTIDGGAGNDTLKGGLGDDNIVGGTGDDTINGGADNDTMTGGDGSDVFVFGANSGVDRITDFAAGADKLDVTALNTTAATLVAGVTSDSDGNAVVTFSSGNSVTLVGVSASNVDASFFTDGSSS